MDIAECKQELKSVLDDQGRLTRFPSKQKGRIAALFYLAAQFEPGKQYTEKEVNAVITQWHTFNDICMLRRDLANKHFLGRENDGSRYWLLEVQPVLADFGL